MDWSVAYLEIILRLVYTFSLAGYVFLFASSYLKKHSFFILRAAISVIVVFSLISVLAFISTFVLSRKEINYDFYWSFSLRSLIDLLTLLLSMSLIEVCYESEPLAILFTVIASFNSYILTYSLYIITSILVLKGYSIDAYDISNLSNIYLLVIYVFIYAFVFTIIYFAFIKKRNVDPNMFRSRLIAILFGVNIVSSIFFFNTFLGQMNNNSFSVSVAGFSMMAVFSILFLILQIYIIQNKRIEQEKEEGEKRIALEAKNYRFSKDVIEMVNIKVHDLKHRLAAMERNGTIDNNAIESLKETATMYDTIVRTSNEALNVILTEKKIFCEKHRITLTTIVDGECLSFMKSDDLYSLIGNVLDNAIEASMKLPYEKRIIGFNLTNKLGMATMEARNNYVGEIAFKNGLPLTTKEDKSSHGFGTKSLSYIAKKYGGNVEFLANDGVFTVEMIFPLSEK